MKYNMITNFIIQKCEPKNDKAPDRRISAKVGDKWVDIASGWVKKDKNGNQYISCQMKKPYKEYKGYEIVEIDASGSPEFSDSEV